MRRVAGAIGIMLCLAVSSVVRAEEVVLTASRDATLIEHPAGALANGSGPALFAGRTGQTQDSRRRALLAFDGLAALPRGARVTRARLVLSLTPSHAVPVVLGLHRVGAPWNEGPAASGGGSGAPSQPGDVTWLHTHYDTDFWTSPGGDFEPLPSAEAVVGGAGDHVWASTPELVADVQRWVDAPVLNAGWALVGGEGAPSTARRFASRESADVDAAPRLLVEYRPACEAAELRRGVRGICRAYCEVLDCEGAEPRGSVRACARLEQRFGARTGGALPPCVLPDADADGVPDDLDDCPATANPEQRDADADSVGDVCDNCPAVANPDQEDDFGAVGVGDVCDCPCFTALEAGGLAVRLQDPSIYSELVCVDTRPTKPLTALSAFRLDGEPCASASADCGALAVSFTEDDACQLNPPAPEPGVVRQGIGAAQRAACRDAILDAAAGLGVSCN